MKHIFTNIKVFIFIFTLIFIYNVNNLLYTQQDSGSFTIKNDFDGGLVRFDGQSYPSGYKYISTQSDFHSFTTITPQTYNGYTWYFKKWNDGVTNMNRGEFFPLGTYTFTAHFIRYISTTIKNCKTDGSSLGGTIKYDGFNFSSPNIFTLLEDSTYTIEPNPTDFTVNGKTYYFKNWEDGSTVKKRVITSNRNIDTYIAYFEDVTTDVKTIKDELPEEYSVQNYPNPFNPSTTFSLEIPKSGYVQLKIYDRIGREIATLVDGVLPKGTHSVQFNGSNLSSGIYMYKMTAGSYFKSGKIMLMK